MYIHADIYTKAKGFHYVKVEIDGVFISGIKVSRSVKFPDQLWIQMPAYKQGSKWKRYIEIANDSEFGKAIYNAIEQAARPSIFGDTDPIPTRTSQDIIPEDIEDIPIDFSKIPF